MMTKVPTVKPTSLRMIKANSQIVVPWETQRTELAARHCHTPRLLVATDFDGTLAPLVDRPEEAQALPAACRALLQLAARRPRVRLAVLSGRSLLDLSTRLGTAAAEAILAGNHGLEIQGAGLDWVHPCVSPLRPSLAELAERLKHLGADLPGVEVEDKYASLTFHYRQASESIRAEALQRLASLLLPEGILPRPGKMIVEFRPNVAWDKGRALRRIMQRLGVPSAAVIYLGDDATDEDAFREVAACGTAVKVGTPEGGTAATIGARDPADAAEFLCWLSEMVGDPKGR